MSIEDKINRMSGMDKVNMISTILANEDDPAEVGSIIATVIKKWTDEHDEDTLYFIDAVSESMHDAEEKFSIFGRLFGNLEEEDN